MNASLKGRLMLLGALAVLASGCEALLTDPASASPGVSMSFAINGASDDGRQPSARHDRAGRQS